MCTLIYIPEEFNNSIEASRNSYQLRFHLQALNSQKFERVAYNLNFVCKNMSNIDEAKLDQDDSKQQQQQKSLSILNSTTISISEQFERIELFLGKLKQSQNQAIQLSMSNLNYRNKRYSTRMVLFAAFLAFLLLLPTFSTKEQLDDRITQLQLNSKKIVNNMIDVADATKQMNKKLTLQISRLQKMIEKQRETIEKLQTKYDKIVEQIYVIYTNELQKQEKSMMIFQKFSNRFKFQINQNVKIFRNNFRSQNGGNSIRKMNDEQKFFYSQNPIPVTSSYFVKLKIIETLYGMISFGVMPEPTSHQGCVYCDSQKMYYIYCKNANIYNGKYLNIMYDYKKSKFNSIKRDDVITMFVDLRDRRAFWYINGKYAAFEALENITSIQNIHVFVQMTSRGDRVQILQ